MECVFLSRRNLLTLLSKLDRRKAGEKTEATIVKQDTIHPQFPCSNVIAVVAVDDDEYYIDRKAGAMHPTDETRIG